MINVRTVQTDGDSWLHIDRGDLAAWQYQIGEYAYGEFNKSLEDMLQPLESEASQEPTEPTT